LPRREIEGNWRIASCCISATPMTPLIDYCCEYVSQLYSYGKYY
jgi:hypothetical protein